MATGISLTVAILMLSLAVTRPFAGFAVAGQVELEVRPYVTDRLPEDLFRVVRATDGVDRAIPISGGMTVLSVGPREHGALLVGSDCSATALFGGEARCEEALRDAAPGPGVPVWVSPRLADALRVSRGDTLAFPGQSAQAAHVAGLLDDSRLDSVNSGYVAASTTIDVQTLTAAGPYLSRIYVDTDTPGATGDVLRDQVGAVAAVGPPGSDLSLFLRGTQWMLWVSAGIVIVSGILMSINALLMSLEARLRNVGVLGVLGAGETSIAVGLAAEGALLGLAAGIVSILPGYLLGVLVTQRFGRRLLDGTGASLATPFEPWIVLVAVAIGIGAGVVSMVPVIVRLMRVGALHVSEKPEPHRPMRPWRHAWLRWAVPASGMGLVAAGLVVAGAIRTGRLTLVWSIPSVAACSVGLLVVSFAVSPLVVWALLARIVRFRASGRLVVAELAREPSRVAAVVATVGLAATIWIGVDTTRVLVTESVTDNLVAEIGDAVYVYPRRAGNQIAGRLDRETLAWLKGITGVATVRPQRLAVVDDGGKVDILGTDPASPRDFLEFGTPVQAEAIWRHVGKGEVVLSSGYAARKGVSAGETIDIPTISGVQSFRVAAVAQPRFGYDNGVGDIAVVSNETATGAFAASVDSVIVTPRAGYYPAELAHQIESSGQYPDVFTNTARSTSESAGRNAERLFGPFDIISFATAAVGALATATFIALMLEQRRRERAVLRFLGLTSKRERVALYMEGAALLLMGLAFGAISGSALAYLLVQLAPILTGGSVSWHPVPAAIGIGALAISGIGIIAFTWPSIEAGNLDVLAAIREE